MIDPYKILGLNRDATVEQIESAFRAKSRQYHPERGGDPKAYEQFKRAYLFLIKQKKKPATDAPVSAESGTQPVGKISIPPIQPKPKNKSPSASADPPSIDFPDLGIDTGRRVPPDSPEWLIVPNHSGNNVNPGDTEPFINLPATRSKATPTKRIKSKSIAQPVMMIFSGLLGLISAFCVSVVGLWYFGKHDPFGLFTDAISRDQTVAKSDDISITEENRNSPPAKNQQKHNQRVSTKLPNEQPNSTITDQAKEQLSDSVQNPENEPSKEQKKSEEADPNVGMSNLEPELADNHITNHGRAVENPDGSESNREKGQMDDQTKAKPDAPIDPQKTDFEKLLEQNGGNAESELAVTSALKWIVEHQLPDGGWSFDHQAGPGNHRTSGNPGQYANGRNGATAMALLSLLGAGQTHRTGEYKKQIEKGLQFLIKNGHPKNDGISFWEEQGTMYSHGLCAIALNKAYLMTKDSKLHRVAKGAVLFTEIAQDPLGGGWRYNPREPGDTSVLGWQISALKLGELNKTKINQKALLLADKFLTNVASPDGAFYGYMDRPNGESADARTAIGLVSRLKLGWDRNSQGVIRGAGKIADRGPRINQELDCYYNYYATCLLKELGGTEWTKWNNKMRNYLVTSQIKTGPASGSWDPANSYGDAKGGRLYVTSLSCLTLQAYYHDLYMQRIEKLDLTVNVNPKPVAWPKVDSNVMANNPEPEIAKPRVPLPPPPKDEILFSRSNADIIREHMAELVLKTRDEEAKVIDLNGQPSLSRFWGKDYVRGSHPVNGEKPARIDFSSLTKAGKGVLKLSLHNHPAGDCLAEVMRNYESIHNIRIQGNNWISFDIPFDKDEQLAIKHSATGWFCESLFFTYKVEYEGDKEEIPNADPLRKKVPDPLEGRGLNCELFANLELIGQPIVKRIDHGIRFGWAEGSPHPSIPDNDFSARWTGFIRVPQKGLYTFQNRVDDHCRVWLDDKKIIDTWDLGNKWTEVSVPMTGQPQKLVVEYKETWGMAHFILCIRPNGSKAFAPIPEQWLFHDEKIAKRADLTSLLQPRNGTGLNAEVFSDRNFQKLVYTTMDWNVARVFEDGPVFAGAKLPVDNFSVRWSGVLLPPQPGDYQFRASKDDKVRLLIDGDLVIDSSNIGGGLTPWAKVTLGNQPVNITVEYSEIDSVGYCTLLWKSENQFGEQIVPHEVFFPTMKDAERAFLERKEKTIR